MTVLSSNYYSQSLLKCKLEITASVRAVMNHNRQITIGGPVETEIDSLHEILLKRWNEIPSLFRPCDLEIKAKVINNIWRSHISFNNHILLLLAAFSYLHLSNTLPEKTFQMPICRVPSLQVLVAILRVAAFIIKSQYTPVIGPVLEQAGII